MARVTLLITAELKRGFRGPFIRCWRLKHRTRRVACTPVNGATRRATLGSAQHAAPPRFGARSWLSTKRTSGYQLQAFSAAGRSWAAPETTTGFIPAHLALALLTFSTPPAHKKKTKSFPQPQVKWSSMPLQLYRNTAKLFLGDLVKTSLVLRHKTQHQSPSCTVHKHISSTRPKYSV